MIKLTQNGEVLSEVKNLENIEGEDQVEQVRFIGGGGVQLVNRRTPDQVTFDYDGPIELAAGVSHGLVNDGGDTASILITRASHVNTTLKVVATLI